MLRKRANKLFILMLSALFSLCSCDNKTNNNNSDDNGGNSGSQIIDDKKEPVNTNILLTEINTGTSVVNRAVEISNIGDSDAKLDGYTLEIYRSYSDKNTNTIKLDNYVIKAHSSFVIAYKDANEEIKSKADLISEDYLNNGTFPVSLNYYDEVIDSIGQIGYIYNFAEYAVLVRLKEYFKQSPSFDEQGWVRYPINTTYTLGNYEVISEEDLLDGPKLNEEAFNKPFIDDSGYGQGGIIVSSLSWTSDGDTSGFYYGYEYEKYDISGSLSTRYYAINTPEIAHSAGEVSDPYGDEAKEFTNNLLRKAKHILIQSVDGYSVHETYGRMLAYIWISDLSNPTINDYQLLNFLIVKNGFSHPAFLDRKASYNSNMAHLGISYVEYIYHAEIYASVHKLNIHSGE